MKILLCHNYYCQPGGEDQVFADEGALLESHGHTLLRYTLHNDRIASMSRVQLALRTIWNWQSYREIQDLIRRERPDVVHCTNIFPLISPSVYYAAQGQFVPVVQSLHNFRIFCANGSLRTEGPRSKPCPGRGSLRCLRAGCYRGDRLATFVALCMLRSHGLLRTWTRKVDQYIALTQSGRDLFVARGLPPEKVSVKPNFVGSDRGVGQGRGDYAVFVGRLCEEKGVPTLLDAWQHCQLPLGLKIIGDGPLAAEVKRVAGRSNIQWLGRRPLAEVLDCMADAQCLVFPSTVNETFGRTIIEAFSTGTPVIAANMESAAELVAHGRTGYLFERGNPQDLAAKVRLLSNAGEGRREIRRAARSEYQEKYTAAANYEELMEIYRRAGACRQGLGRARPPSRRDAQGCEAGAHKPYCRGGEPDSPSAAALAIPPQGGAP